MGNEDDLGRGVFRLPCVHPSGARPMVAIDSEGICRAWYLKSPDEDLKRVSGVMYRELEKAERQETKDELQILNGGESGE